MARNLPGPSGPIKGEGVYPTTKPSYICAKCQQTFKWYKGVKVLGGGIGLCTEHNPHYKRDDALLADAAPEDVPAPEAVPPCNTTK